MGAVVFLHEIDPADVGMVDGSEGSCLPAERVGGRIFRQYFLGDVACEPDVVRLAHDAHHPLAEVVLRTGAAAPFQMYPKSGGKTITTIAAHTA